MFEEELESYKQAMEKRKADHAAAIERQRQELAARMQELQTKQNQVFQKLLLHFFALVTASHPEHNYLSHLF